MRVSAVIAISVSLFTIQLIHSQTCRATTVKYNAQSREAERLRVEKEYISATNTVHVKKPFHVWYDARASVFLTDVNQNNVPDIVEKIETQLDIARFVFHEICKFKDPLKSKRFLHTSHIDVIIVSDRLLRMPLDRSAVTGYASPRSYASAYTDNSHKGLKAKSLKIFLHVPAQSKNPIVIKNNTALHEYFHLVQYVEVPEESRYKLLLQEGTADWAKDSIENFDKYYKKKTVDELREALLDEKTYSLSYRKAVEHIWGPLIALCGTTLKFRYKTTTYADRTSIFEDQQISGSKLIRKVFACIDEQTTKEKRNSKKINEIKIQQHCLFEILKTCSLESK